MVATVLLVIAEIGLALLAPVPNPYTVEQLRSPSINRYIRSEHARNSNFHTEVEYGLPGMAGKARFTTNNLGFRGDSLLIPKPQDETRVFLVGGSTTECLYLDDSVELGAVTQRHLRQLTGDNNIHVYNTGGSGMASDDHIALIAQRLVHLEPDVVVVFCGINDLIQAMTGHDYLHYATRSRAPTHSRTKTAAMALQVVRRAYYFKQRVSPDQWQTRLFFRPKSHYRHNVGLQLDAPRTNAAPRTHLSSYARNLHSIAALVRSAGADIVLVTQATTWNSSVDENARDWHWMRLWNGVTYDEVAMDAALGQYNNAMRAIATSISAPCYDLDREAPKSLEYFYDDCHFNVKGAETAGSGLARIIAKHTLAPAAD